LLDEIGTDWGNSSKYRVWWRDKWKVRLGVLLLDEMGTDWGDSSKYRVWWRDTVGKRQMEGLGVDGKIIQ
jgi:hypothetical protein